MEHTAAMQLCNTATLQHCKGAAPSPMNPGGEGHIIDSIRPDTGGTQAEEGKSGGGSELGRTCESIGQSLPLFLEAGSLEMHCINHISAGFSRPTTWSLSDRVATNAQKFWKKGDYFCPGQPGS